MKRYYRILPALFLILALLMQVFISCAGRSEQPPATQVFNPIKDYAVASKGEYSFKFYKTIPGKGYTTHVLRMISGKWLTEKEVQETEWWHWIHIVVPDTLTSSTALLMIGGGKREQAEPKDANATLREIALATHSLVAQLHNVPNQPLHFVNDSYGPRSEDELIAYGWRKFLQAGAGDDQVQWLARLPMTRAAIRAMDAISSYSVQTLKQPIDRFVTAGGSKRGWTTWATAIADERVVAIIPLVIDLLNLEPSFKHHWQAYGAWSEAVNDYVREGIMEWMGSQEFNRLLKNVDPYSYRQRLQLPKMLINASSDEFFLPDSWRFYWQDLVGEKHLRYVANTGHSLKKTDAEETVAAFFHSIVTNTPRPDFDWQVEDGAILIQTKPKEVPKSIKLWQAFNEKARDFREPVLGKAWSSSDISLTPTGSYRITVDRPQTGWRAFFVELTFSIPGKFPLKLSTGVTVVPEQMPYPSFKPKTPQGTP